MFHTGYSVLVVVPRATFTSCNPGWGLGDLSLDIN